jgi:homoserine dehydrogenase
VDCVVELVGGRDGHGKAPSSERRSPRQARGDGEQGAPRKARDGACDRSRGAGVSLAFEASVAGGIPVIKTLREAMPGNRDPRLYGILNGTCNYILSRMELEGLTFAACLKDAQRLGYAEATPPSTSRVRHGPQARDPDEPRLRHADRRRCHLRRRASPRSRHSTSPWRRNSATASSSLGVAERTKTGIEQRVHPTMVPRATAIAQVMGVTNAVTIDADAVRELT